MIKSNQTSLRKVSWMQDSIDNPGRIRLGHSWRSRGVLPEHTRLVTLVTQTGLRKLSELTGKNRTGQRDDRRSAHGIGLRTTLRFLLPSFSVMGLFT
jgi:hypothetical protein